MGLRDEYRKEVEKVEESLGDKQSYKEALDLKIFLDNILPFIFLLLTFIIIFEFFLTVNETVAMWIQWANWTVISYFALRLVVEFKLATSRKSFFRNHWFDFLLVVPLFSVMKEAHLARYLTEYSLISLGDEAAAIRNTGAAARLTRIARIIKRSA